MSDSDLVDRLNAATARALAETADEPLALADQAQAGDLLRLSGARDAEVEWLLLIATPAENSSPWFLVPVDGGTLLGSADVGIYDSASDLVRCARVGHGMWLQPDAVRDSMRVGRLAPEDVSRCRAHWSRLEEVDAPGKSLGREIDEHPDYQDWIDEVVVPACRSVEASLDQTEEPKSTASWSNRWLWAALLLLSVGGVIGIQSLRYLGDRVEDAERRLVLAQEEVMRSRENLEKAIGDLAKAREALGSVDFPNNPILAFLHSPRGELKIKIGVNASHVLIGLPEPDVSAGGSFRLSLSPLNAQEPLWSASGLVPNSEGHLWAGFPAALAPDGKYRLVLEHDDGENLQSLDEFPIEIAREN